MPAPKAGPSSMLASPARPGLGAKTSGAADGVGSGGTGSRLRVSREKIPPRFSGGGGSGCGSAIASALIRAS